MAQPPWAGWLSGVPPPPSPPATALASFTLFEEQGCWWSSYEADEILEYSDAAPYTRATCAEMCLSADFGDNGGSCTGFEIPADGEYCALYYDWACDLSGLPETAPPGYDDELDGYATYTLIP